MSKYLDIPARFITESYADSVIESDKTVENVQPVEEVYEECDMFIELGDSMFYVSEYHNALFDDPDAHDEVINEFGILLDSYDDDLIEETFKPYDEYLKKHKYDPKTNTIEDPDEPGRRVSAGRIGSNKERNRMNKFLRENGYDPKTETIQTDLDDPKNPGAKKRLKFGINSQIGHPGKPMQLPGAYAQPDRYNGDDDDDEYASLFEQPGISMSKSAMQLKRRQSQALLKHEEGHHAQWQDKKKFVNDRRAGQRIIKKYTEKDPTYAANPHGSNPEEFVSDKYAIDHTKKPDLIGGVSSLDKDMIKSLIPVYRKQLADIRRVYGTTSDQKTLDKMKKDLKDQYDFFGRWYTSDGQTPPPHAQKAINDMKREIESGFPNTIAAWKALSNKSDKDFIKQQSALWLNDDTHNSEKSARAEFAERQMKRKARSAESAAAKQRQLSKEQLKQQIASGKLTKDQLAKAKRKLQRIEQFEKSQRK